MSVTLKHTADDVTVNRPLGLLEKAGHSDLDGTLTTRHATLGRQHALGMGTGVDADLPLRISSTRR